MSLYSCLCLSYSRVCCFGLDVSALQQFVLFLDVSLLQKTVLALDESDRQKNLLAQDVSLVQQP